MNDPWTLALGRAPEPWLLAVLILVGGVALTEALLAFARPRAALTRSRRLLLLLLRLLGVAALAASVLELTYHVDRLAPAAARVVVLLDTSASMQIADAAADEPPIARLDRLRQRWLADASTRERWRARGLTLELHAFDRELRDLSPRRLDDLDALASGSASDLTRALSQLADAHQRGDDPRPIAALLLLSDGLVAADPAADAALNAAALALRAPITTLAAGAPRLRDLAIHDLQAAEFAFVEGRAELRAQLIAHGLEGSLAEIELRQGGAPVAAQRVTLPADGQPIPLRFEFVPDRVGHFVYELVVAPQPGEATLDNNRRAVIIKVLRDKVRVLHVAGRPDWDVRALRTLLRRDPNVELLSYYILRDLEDSDREDPNAELSLIAFPTDELFSEQLDTFDLIVLHNFDARAHQVGRYLGDIARYAAGGGALVVIGGDLGLATADYRASPLAPLLLLDLDGDLGLSTAPYRPVLTEPGRRHPITAWIADPRLEGGARLPMLDSFNRARLAAAAAPFNPAVLLAHPDGAPLLAVAEPGKGRVAVLTTGATWRLGFAPDLPMLDGARPYDRLWLGLIRWLIRDPSAERLTLDLSAAHVRPDEPVELRLTALTAGYAPEPDVPLRWQLRPLGGDHQPAPSDSQKIDPDLDPPPLAEGELITDPLGRAAHRLPPLPEGAYELLAERRPPPQGPDQAPTPPHWSESTARRVLLVDAGARELTDLAAAPGDARLAQLARLTGGLALRASEGDPLPDDLPLADDPLRAAPRVEARREAPLWDSAPALALLFLALGLEWILRRRAGLV
jgi:hypothetical protein